MAGEKRNLLKPQKIMHHVIIALLPCVFGSIYFFGWRSLAMIAVSCAVAFLIEYIFCRKRGEPASEAVFVTGVLYALVMPPSVPWHVLIIGIAFAIMFGKEVFGGFGRNIFNPALVGRCFVYICFPVSLTGRWSASAPFGGMGALGRWTTATADAITSATPMSIMKTGGDVPSFAELFFGGISGTMGVTAAILIIIGGVYLFWTKTASRTTILSVIIPYAIFNQVLAWLGVEPFVGAWPAILGGGFLFGAFFMATDPVSSPRTQLGKVFYGIIIATGTTVIRNYSIFNGGLMFSILLGNMFAPIIDYAVVAYQNRGKVQEDKSDEK